MCFFCTSNGLFWFLFRGQYTPFYLLIFVQNLFFLSIIWVHNLWTDNFEIMWSSGLNLKGVDDDMLKKFSKFKENFNRWSQFLSEWLTFTGFNYQFGICNIPCISAGWELTLCRGSPDKRTLVASQKLIKRSANATDEFLPTGAGSEFILTLSHSPTLWGLG